METPRIVGMVLLKETRMSAHVDVIMSAEADVQGIRYARRGWGGFASSA
ncbi:hypothetical protein [Caballeronia sp. Lep1P3]|nr:hypothetical protein [Caballeronia sp. Lep1P3]